MSSGVTLTQVACSYQGAGLGSPGVAEGPAQVVALFDVDAGRAVQGLKPVSVQLIDARGAVVARSVGVLQLRVAPPTRTARDMSSYGTSLFDGNIQTGQKRRLWLQGALDQSAGKLELKAPVRYRAEFAARGVAPLVVTGKLQAPLPS